MISRGWGCCLGGIWHVWQSFLCDSIRIYITTPNHPNPYNLNPSDLCFNAWGRLDFFSSILKTLKIKWSSANTIMPQQWKKSHSLLASKAFSKLDAHNGFWLGFGPQVFTVDNLQCPLPQVPLPYDTIWPKYVPGCISNADGPDQRMLSQSNRHPWWHYRVMLK